MTDELWEQVERLSAATGRTYTDIGQVGLDVVTSKPQLLGQSEVTHTE